MSITHLSLFRRLNGFWYPIYNEDGRVRWKSTRSKSEHKHQHLGD